MKNLIRISWLLGLALAGCGMGTVGADDALDTEGDALSSQTAAYVTVVRDQRKCAYPTCGGYYLSQPNRSAAPIYVKGFDFSQSSLGDADQAKVNGAPDAELLLFGKLSAKDSKGYRNLVVLDAYRGLPGRTPDHVSAVFQIGDSGIRCITAPCNSLKSHKLNSTSQDKTFSTFSVASAAYGFVDQNWLTHRVMDGRAIVTGSITAASGNEVVFDATQVFLHLPENAGPCPTFMAMNCAASGQVNIYSRNADRCEVPAGCTTAGVCSMMVPACPDGYSLTGMPAGQFACTAYSCDPSWVVE